MIVGFEIGIFGSLFSWILSIFMSGFGQLVENSDTLVALAKENKQSAQHISELYSLQSSKATDQSAQDISLVNRNKQTEIKINTFYDNQKLTNYIVKDGIQKIGDGAFGNCIKLALIVIPNSVASIGDLAFSNCISLKKIYYTGTFKEWNAIHIGSGNEVLSSANIYYYSKSQPTTSGNNWRYVDGVPTAWE